LGRQKKFIADKNGMHADVFKPDSTNEPTRSQSVPVSKNFAPFRGSLRFFVFSSYAYAESVARKGRNTQKPRRTAKRRDGVRAEEAVRVMLKQDMALTRELANRHPRSKRAFAIT
jgi:hypothetical protein